MYKALECIVYLHSKNIYYGDMKPHNLLIFKDYRVKIGDFGVSIKIPSDQNEQNSLYIRGLTPKYCSQDIIIANKE